MFQHNYYNDNLLKLKELSDKICQLDYEKNHCDVCDYKNIVIEIVNLIELSKEVISSQPDNERKLECYEEMCCELKEIIKKVGNNINKNNL